MLDKNFLLQFKKILTIPRGSRLNIESVIKFIESFIEPNQTTFPALKTSKPSLNRIVNTIITEANVQIFPANETGEIACKLSIHVVKKINGGINKSL